MIKCIIIDDEPLAAQLLASYASKVDDLEIVGVFHNPLSALNVLKTASIDLILLDIQMPELSGTQVAKIINRKIEIIFTTAYPDYAVEGFELKALDYLVKPISFARFINAIDRLRRIQESSPLTLSNHADVLFVKSEYRLQKIDTQNILYLQGNGDYCNIVCTDKKVLTLEKLNSFEGRLSSKQFIRVHKSYIVSLNKIDYIEKKRIKIGNAVIPIGLTYEDKLKRFIDN